MARTLNPNEAEARLLVATFIERMMDLGYLAVAVLTDAENEYHWTATAMPKDVVVTLLRDEANALERDASYAEQIKCPHLNQVHVNLCPKCAEFLRDLEAIVGREALLESGAPVSTVAHCSVCSPQLPDELRRAGLAEGSPNRGPKVPSA